MREIRRKKPNKGINFKFHINYIWTYFLSFLGSMFGWKFWANPSLDDWSLSIFRTLLPPTASKTPEDEPSSFFISLLLVSPILQFFAYLRKWNNAQRRINFKSCTTLYLRRNTKRKLSLNHSKEKKNYLVAEMHFLF